MMANSSDQAHAFVDPNMSSSTPVCNPTTTNYQDHAASLDSRLKAIWDDQMGPKTKKNAFYRKTVVLLLSWHPDVDDLKTAEEVVALENVLKHTFHYKTERKILTQDPRRTAQVQVNFALCQFVYDHDDPNTLLIVYYAGHGKPGESNIGLNLTGNIRNQSTDAEDNSELHEIIWHSAEQNIRAIRSDVLVIFDCCHAGQLEKNIRSGFRNRAFEYLAATSANSTTRKPGPRSFTRAMIWALEELVESEKSFSTQELLNKILQAPDFPKDQYPRLSERDRTCLRRIVLAPLDETLSPVPSTEPHDDPAGAREDLSLRFVFNKSITPKLVSGLAIELRRVMNVDNFNVTAILWEGVNSLSSTSYENSTARYYAHKWLRNTRKKSNGALPSNRSPQIEPPIDPIPQLEPPETSSSEDSTLATPRQEISQTLPESGSNQRKARSSLKSIGPLPVSTPANSATRKRTREETSSLAFGDGLVGNTSTPLKRTRRGPEAK